MRKELNVLIDTGFLRGDELEVFFQISTFEDGVEVLTLPETTDMADLLVTLGLFPSKSQARKNWKKTGLEIPWGFSDFEHLGKLHHRLTIFKPTFDNLLDIDPEADIREV